jgi:hypothetical protein
MRGLERRRSVRPIAATAMVDRDREHGSALKGASGRDPSEAGRGTALEA